eukprot:755152-Hanusia_phi.AAC.4
MSPEQQHRTVTELQTLLLSVRRGFPGPLAQDAITGCSSAQRILLLHFSISSSYSLFSSLLPSTSSSPARLTLLQSESKGLMKDFQSYLEGQRLVSCLLPP